MSNLSNWENRCLWLHLPQCTSWRYPLQIWKILEVAGPPWLSSPSETFQYTQRTEKLVLIKQINQTTIDKDKSSTLKSCVSQTGSAHLWDLIRWLASNTVPRNVSDLPTLWSGQKMTVLILDQEDIVDIEDEDVDICWPDWQEHSNPDGPSSPPDS